MPSERAAHATKGNYDGKIISSQPIANRGRARSDPGENNRAHISVWDLLANCERDFHIEVYCKQPATCGRVITTVNAASFPNLQWCRTRK